MSSSYRIGLENWLPTVSAEGEYIFDVGGSQLPIEGRIGRLECKNLVTFDLEQPHKDSPQPDVVLDLNKSVSRQVMGYKGMGDVIFCLEVFDYVYNPVRAMQTLADLLKKGGKLYVTFPTQYPLHQPIEDDALRYMPAGIEKIAEEVGLKVVSMRSRMAETGVIEDFIRAERLRAAKHENHRVLGYIVEFTR